MKIYHGSCHCGAVTFTFQSHEITSGLRCNCSICRRKNAVMTDFTLPPDELAITVQADQLGQYEFDNKIAKHYFCKQCGIYPFHQTVRKPGEYRVNLGCVDELDIDQLQVAVFDGRQL